MELKCAEFRITAEELKSGDPVRLVTGGTKSHPIVHRYVVRTEPGSKRIFHEAGKLQLQYGDGTQIGDSIDLEYLAPNQRSTVISRAVGDLDDCDTVVEMVSTPFEGAEGASLKVQLFYSSL